MKRERFSRSDWSCTKSWISLPKRFSWSSRIMIKILYCRVPSFFVAPLPSIYEKPRMPISKKICVCKHVLSSQLLSDESITRWKRGQDNEKRWKGIDKNLVFEYSINQKLRYKGTDWEDIKTEVSERSRRRLKAAFTWSFKKCAQEPAGGSKQVFRHVVRVKYGCYSSVKREDSSS